MTKTICGTAVLLTMCVGPVLADRPRQTQPVRIGRLDPRIGSITSLSHRKNDAGVMGKRLEADGDEI